MPSRIFGVSSYSSQLAHSNGDFTNVFIFNENAHTMHIQLCIKLDTNTETNTNTNTKNKDTKNTKIES